MSDKIEFPMGWTVAILQDLLDYIQPTNFIVESTEYDDRYKTPVLTAGKTFLLGKTNETTGIFTNLPVIIFDDFTTATKFVNFPFKVKSSAMKILKPTCKWVDIWYAYYFIQTIRITVDTHKRYWISNYSQLPILLPPLAEQHRIVAKIEELFSSLDKGIESLKTAQAQLKTYRQAVLKWAFEGKLTNANVKDGELPEGWKWQALTTIATAIDPQPSHRTPPIDINGVPYVGIGDVDFEKGVFDFENARRVSKKVLEEHKKRYSLEQGDFVIGKIGTIGKPFKIPFERFYTLSANIVLIKPNPHLCSGDYLFYLSSSNIIERQFKAGSKATTQAAFGIKKVRTLSIPLPPTLPEQSLIVSEIEKRLSVCDKLEESITQSLSQAEALRQSILKKAFEGKLVSQDPNDEPASVLLERIRAERAISSPIKKTRTPKGKK